MRRDRGQATVELALALPVVAVALLLVVQVGLVVRAQILTVQAARDAARAAAVGEPQAPSLPAGLDPARLAVATTSEPAAGRVRVSVRYRQATDVPLVGAALPDVTVTATATMRLER